MRIAVHHITNFILGFNNRVVNSKNNLVLKLSLNKMKVKFYKVITGSG